MCDATATGVNATRSPGFPEPSKIFKAKEMMGRSVVLPDTPEPMRIERVPPPPPKKKLFGRGQQPAPDHSFLVRGRHTGAEAERAVSLRCEQNRSGTTWTAAPPDAGLVASLRADHDMQLIAGRAQLRPSPLIAMLAADPVLATLNGADFGACRGLSSCCAERNSSKMTARNRLTRKKPPIIAISTK